jgi:hypothetical protein
MKRSVERYLASKNYVNIKDREGRYLIGNDIEGVLKAVRTRRSKADDVRGKRRRGSSEKACERSLPFISSSDL